MEAATLFCGEVTEIFYSLWDFTWPSISTGGWISYLIIIFGWTFPLKYSFIQASEHTNRLFCAEREPDEREYLGTATDKNNWSTEHHTLLAKAVSSVNPRCRDQGQRSGWMLLKWDPCWRLSADRHSFCDTVLSQWNEIVAHTVNELAHIGLRPAWHLWSPTLTYSKCDSQILDGVFRTHALVLPGTRTLK